MSSDDNGVNYDAITRISFCTKHPLSLFCCIKCRRLPFPPTFLLPGHTPEEQKPKKRLLGLDAVFTTVAAFVPVIRDSEVEGKSASFECEVYF